MAADPTSNRSSCTTTASSAPTTRILWDELTKQLTESASSKNCEDNKYKGDHHDNHVDGSSSPSRTEEISTATILKIRKYSQQWKDQLLDYINEMSTPKNRSKISGSPQMKDLIINTRNALRFASTCLQRSSPASSSSSSSASTKPNESSNNIQNSLLLLQKIQNEIVIRQLWIVPLTQLVMLKDRRDVRCHVMACKLFNNLETQNPTTSSLVAVTAVASASASPSSSNSSWGGVTLSPSSEQISRSILQKDFQFKDDDDNEGDDEQLHYDHHQDPNWVDMILSASSCSTTTTTTKNSNKDNTVSSSNREALAAVVATLHNCLAALPLLPSTTAKPQEQQQGDDGEFTKESPLVTQLQFAKLISSDGLLVSTLLRLFVPANKVIATRKNDNDNENGDSLQCWDDATEWIELLLVRLTGLGFLPTMFQSLNRKTSTTGPTDEKEKDNIIIDEGSDNDAVIPTFVPEQIVLLKVVAQEIDEYMKEHASLLSSSGQSRLQVNNDESSSDKNLNNDGPHRRRHHHPLGGLIDVDVDDGEGTLQTCRFLSDIVVNLSPIFPKLFTFTIKDAAGRYGIDGKNDDNEVVLLQQYVLSTILHILGMAVAIDDDSSTNLRKYLGQSTRILQDALKDLGYIVDNLAARSVGKKARDVVMTSNEQSLMTTFVQLIGNLAHHCPSNQDIIRCTLVPPGLDTDGDKNGTAPETPQSSPSSSSSSVSRNGLHVLLSCTSYSTSCFGLREWAVLAIRNVLENNTENQSLVAELFAQDPVKSADLEHLGINVKLDTKTGKVSMSSINKEKTRSSSSNEIEVIQEDDDVNDEEEESSDGAVGNK